MSDQEGAAATAAAEGTDAPGAHAAGEAEPMDAEAAAPGGSPEAGEGQPVHQEEAAPASDAPADGAAAAATGPAPDGTTPDASDPMLQPPHGTEVFLSNIPHEASDEEVKAFASQAGEVYAARIPRPPPSTLARGVNRGFAFVVYTTRDMAARAVEVLNGTELPGHTGRKVRAVVADAKNKLYCGNVPRAMKSAEVEAALKEHVAGLEELTVLPDPAAPGFNRGFAFLTFYNYAAAEAAKKKLEGISLGGRELRVTWAEPQTRQTAETPQIKAVYVSGLPDSATEEQLRTVFTAYGEVERVFLPMRRDAAGKHRHYAFVHFTERTSALAAVEAAAGDAAPTIDGAALTVALAKSPEGGGRGDGPPHQRGGGGWGSSRPAGGRGGGYGSARYGGYEAGPYEGGEYEEEGDYEEGPGAGAYGFPGGAPAAGVMVPVLLPGGQVGYIMTSGMAAAAAVGGGGPVRRGAGSTGGGYGRSRPPGGGYGRGGGGGGSRTGRPY